MSSPLAAVPAGVPDPSELLVVGSIALDTRDGPFGKVREELGGSAGYFALAASLVRPVQVAGPDGRRGDDVLRAGTATRVERRLETRVLVFLQSGGIRCVRWRGPGAFQAAVVAGWACFESGTKRRHRAHARRKGAHTCADRPPGV